MFDVLLSLIFPAILLILALFMVMLVVSRLYKRASKEVAFVRTGLGRSLVVVDGGALILPVVHGTVPVSLKTHKLTVRKAQAEALITKDKFRADATVEFYVRVAPNADAINRAAQTLGDGTGDAQSLMALVEAKFVDGLRAVAAQMTLEDLHLKRAQFVQMVQEVVKPDLEKNGLELETASLTGLDQTDEKYFNPANSFDAEGLARLKEITESKRRERFEIEQTTEVAIKERELDAHRRKLDIERASQEASLAQTQELATRRAEQAAIIAREEAAREKEAQEARILAQRAIAEAEIEKEKLVALANQQREIEIAEKSRAKIDADRSVRQRQIEADRAIQTASIETDKAVEIARQQRDIEVAAQSKAKSAAEAEAALARAEAVRSEEAVETARAVEIAERVKRVRLVEAAQDAEQQALGLRIAAEADKLAAAERAEALRLGAQADADAERIKAEARRVFYAIEAEGQRQLNEQRNSTSAEAMNFEVRMKLIEMLPAILAEMAKPMERIESIKVVQMDGLPRALGGGGGADDGGPRSLPEQITSAALNYSVGARLLSGLLRDAGFSSEELGMLPFAAAAAGATVTDQP